jgi:arylformamidase
MTAAYKEIVDLGHEYFNGMPNLGASHAAFFPLETHAATHQLSEGKLEMEGRMILMAEHCGTHLDAPRHFDPSGISVDQLPLERLVMPGHLLDLTHRKNGESITIEDFERAEELSGRRISGDSATICWTGADRDWGKPEFHMLRPYVAVEAAQWLADRGMTLFCTDLIGMDDPTEWWWPTHKVWLRRGICMVQQLCNLERLVGKEFLFIALPLKMRDGTGSPVRAIALVM